MLESESGGFGHAYGGTPDRMRNLTRCHFTVYSCPAHYCMHIILLCTSNRSSLKDARPQTRISAAFASATNAAPLHPDGYTRRPTPLQPLHDTPSE